MQETAFLGCRNSVDSLKNRYIQHYYMLHPEQNQKNKNKRTKSKESIFKSVEGTICNIFIHGYCYSEFDMIFLVDKIVRKDNNKIVPSFAKVQHIILALKEGTRARDSVKNYI